MTGALYRIAGVTPEQAPQARDALTQHALWYLESGGTLSLSDWAELDQLERVAFVAAGRHMAIKQAERIGLAMQGEIGALKLRAEVDQGRAHDAALLSAAVDQVAAQRRGGC